MSKEMKKKQVLKTVLSTTENKLFNLHQKEYSYSEMVNELKIEIPKHVRNAIKRVQQKVIKVERLKEMINEINKQINDIETYMKSTKTTSFSFKRYNALSVEEIEEFEQTHDYSLPVEYTWLVEEVGNGILSSTFTIYSLEEAFEKKKESTIIIGYDQNYSFFIEKNENGEGVLFMKDNYKNIQEVENKKVFLSWCLDHLTSGLNELTKK